MAGLAVTVWTTAMADTRYDFNDDTVPSGVRGMGGSVLSVSQKQVIEGAHALRWDWRERSTLEVELIGPELEPDANTTIQVWVYSLTSIAGPGMELCAGTEGHVSRRTRVELNFTGWRQLSVAFADMQGQADDRVTFLRFIPPSDTGTLFIDDLRVTAKGDQYRFHVARLAAIEELEPLPDPANLAGIRELRRRLGARYGTITAPGTDQIETLLNRAEDYQVETTTEGMVGKPINLTTFDKLMKDLALAHRGATAREDKTRLADTFVTLTRYMLDRGFAARSLSNQKLWYGSLVHYEPFFLMQDVLAADAALLDEVSAAVRWANVSGRVLFEGDRDEWGGAPTGYMNQAGQMDYLICDLWGHMYSMLTGRDVGKQAALLKAWGKWVEVSLCTHHYDSRGQIKPDGCLYHHWMLYSGYGLPGITRLAEVAAFLDGTPFEVTQPVYDKLKFAYMRARLWAYPRFGTIAFGRHPLGRAWTLPGVRELAMAKPGTDAFDAELAAVHARVGGLSAADTLRIYGSPVQPESEPDGYWSFNHAAAGILHRHGRAVHFKGFASTGDYVVRGTEIYADRDNAYGRFQNYGTIEVFRYGDSSQSGFHYDGWDWRKYPGTTTLLLPLDRMKGPHAPKMEAPFAGSCHLDNRQGLFAFALNQGARETLTVRKSAYAMASGVIVCLGSDISSDCDDSETITTLFQNGLDERTVPVSIGGGTIASFPTSRTLTTTDPLEVGDAYGNAYVLQPGTSLHLERSRQQSRHDKKDGLRQTEGDFATAWLSHGKRPDGASYHYTIVPGADAQLVQRLLSEDPDYTIRRQDRQAHIIEDSLTRSTAIVAFEGGLLNHELIHAIDRPCFVILRSMATPGQGRIRVAVCDPNLNYRGKEPTTVVLTLKGRWHQAEGADATVAVSASSGRPALTRVEVICNTGLPVNFTLHP